MFFYEIGYSDWDSTQKLILHHHDKFKDDEFNEILLKSYVIANDITENLHKEWFNEWLEERLESDSELDSESIKSMKYDPVVSDLNHVVISVLINDFGFKQIDITQKFIPSDYNILNNEMKSDCELVNMIRNRFLITENRDKKINKILK